MITEIPPFQYRVPTPIDFGAGRIHALQEYARKLFSKPFVVTGMRSAQVSGALDKLCAQLSHPVVFNAPENPTDTLCEQAAIRCREAACDGIVALGGGSALDVGKAVAALARNPGPCASYFGTEKLERGALPLIAIPTTAGTGSEVTPYAVLTRETETAKRTISAECLFPKVAILDPELTLSVPRPVTINTGLDALSQAMEGLVSKKSTPLGDVLALETCRIVRQWLPRAVRDGADLAARGWMLYAAMLSGCVIAQSGTTLVHGMGYYLTLRCGIPHGLANGLLLTPVFRHNAAHAPQKVAALASALGVPVEATVAGARQGITEALKKLLDELEVPRDWAHYGVKPEELAKFADDIVQDTYRFKNQIGELNREDVRRLYKEAGEAGD